MMKRPEAALLLILFLFTRPLFSRDAETDTTKIYSATDSTNIAELTSEELQFYRSDYFPLSFGEMGRQSASAWRGMPPGFLDYRFRNFKLVNPLWGYWDNQLLPLEIIRTQQTGLNPLNYRIIPAAVKLRGEPLSRIAYAQDFQFGLSYLDAGLQQFYRPGSYFRLGGNNFIRNGSAPQYTQFQVNTYRAEIHHQFSPALSIDFWYWQLRHKFRISTFPVVGATRRVHRVGQLLWANLNFAPDSTQKLTLTPYGNKWGENYYTPGYSEHRKAEILSGGLKFDFRRTFTGWRIETTGDVKQNRVSEALHLEKNHQLDARFTFRLEKDWGKNRLSAGGGYRYLQRIGNAPVMHLGFTRSLPLGIESEVRAAFEPQNIPLAPLFWQDDSIARISGPDVPVRQSLNVRFTIPLRTNASLTLEPFMQQFLDAWGYNPAGSRFEQYDYKNGGISANLDLQISRFHLNNEFTFSNNYQESFIPRVNNVLTANVPISLFNRALKLDAYAIYHFIGKWRMLDYDALVNQYVRTWREAGDYHLLDFKILAHVKTATLFFVWENTLSQDYALITDYTEVYRLFRLGIYWTFFN